jgi:predicted DNA-binding transcriptional regulator AlpA
MAVETHDKLLVSAGEAAVLCSVSRSLWWSMHSAGKVPLPIRLSRRTLWRADELREWTKAGCPARDRWLTMKGTNL